MTISAVSTGGGSGSSAKGRDKPYKNIWFIEKVLSDDKEMMKLFEMWRVEHGKEYDTDEDKLKRFGIFKDNAKEIHDTHLKTPYCFKECYCGLNGYSDITYEEHRSYCCGEPSDDEEPATTN